MKRKEGKLVKLSPNEEAQLIREEQERRRILRIQQVREQQRHIARCIRKNVEQRRLQELDLLEKELRAEWEQHQRERVDRLQTLYQENLSLLDHGHRNAKKNEQDLSMLHQQKLGNESKAEERYHKALKELHLQRRTNQEKQNRSLDDRRRALQVEKVRSAKLASLPLPSSQPLPAQEVVCKPQHMVKRCDASSFVATHYHMPETLVDKETASSQPSTCAEEELEMQRWSLMRREEQQEKAWLRGKQALRREQLQQDRGRLLGELEHLQQTDHLRRRRRVVNIPRQIFEPLYRRQEAELELQRDMEFAFEDMYSGERRLKGDHLCVLVQEPLPPASTDSHCQELDVTQDELTSSDRYDVGQDDTGRRAHRDNTDSEAPSKDAVDKAAYGRRGLKRLLNRIQTQKWRWSESDRASHSSPDSASERQSSLDTGPLAEDDRLSKKDVDASANSAKLIQELEEQKKKKEEMERQEHMQILEQLEQQRLRLERKLCKAQSESALLNSQPRPEVVSHSRTMEEHRLRLLQPNKVHQRSVEVAHQRLEEYQRALRIRHMTAVLPAAVPPPALPPPALPPPALPPPALPPSDLRPSAAPPSALHPPAAVAPPSISSIANPPFAVPRLTVPLEPVPPPAFSTSTVPPPAAFSIFTGPPAGFSTAMDPPAAFSTSAGPPAAFSTSTGPPSVFSTSTGPPAAFSTSTGPPAAFSISMGPTAAFPTSTGPSSTVLHPPAAVGLSSFTPTAAHSFAPLASFTSLAPNLPRVQQKPQVLVDRESQPLLPPPRSDVDAESQTSSDSSTLQRHDAFLKFIHNRLGSIKSQQQTDVSLATSPSPVVLIKTGPRPVVSMATGLSPVTSTRIDPGPLDSKVGPSGVASMGEVEIPMLDLQQSAQARTTLLQTLLKALEHSNFGTSHHESPQASSFGSRSGSFGCPSVLSVPSAAAPTPPLSRARLGFVDRTLHQLSVIQEVNTPASLSLLTGFLHHMDSAQSLDFESGSGFSGSSAFTSLHSAEPDSRICPTLSSTISTGSFITTDPELQSQPDNEQFCVETPGKAQPSSPCREGDFLDQTPTQKSPELAPVALLAEEACAWHIEGEDSFRPLEGKLSEQSLCVTEEESTGLEQLLGHPSAHSSMIGQRPGSSNLIGWDSTMSHWREGLLYRPSNTWQGSRQDVGQTGPSLESPENEFSTKASASSGFHQLQAEVSHNQTQTTKSLEQPATCESWSLERIRSEGSFSAAGFFDGSPPNAQILPILKDSFERGILEQSQITLVSLTDSSSDEQEPGTAEEAVQGADCSQRLSFNYTFRV